jgi:hypothetical protein
VLVQQVETVGLQAAQHLSSTALRMCFGRLFLPAVTPESGEVKVERLTIVARLDHRVEHAANLQIRGCW